MDYVCQAGIWSGHVLGNRCLTIIIAIGTHKVQIDRQFKK